jgi:predicted sulfurtransferase
MRKRYRWIILVAVLVLAGLCETTLATEQTATLITKENKSMLGDPNVIIVDLRKSKDYNDSDLKIKGAVRESILKIKDWAPKYAKTKTMVLYCT